MIVARPTFPAILPAIAAAAAVVLGLAVVLYPQPSFLLLGPISFALVLLNPGAAVPLLILASALNRFGLHWGDAAIRVDYIVTLLLAALVSLRIAVRTLELRALASPLLPPLILYTVANLFSTLVFATERTRGLKLDVEIVAVALSYVTVLALLARKRDLNAAILGLWIVTVGEAAIGLFFAAAADMHLTSYGVAAVSSGLPAAFGTQWEPNIFGSFLLANFFLLLGDYVRGRRSLLATAGLIVIVLGIVASLTRVVWLGLVLGGCIFLALALRGRETKLPVVPVLAGVPILALAALVLGSATPLASRVLDIVNLQTSSAAGRLALFQAALQDWFHHPLFGSGTGSFNFGAVPGQPHPWLPNLFLLTLHDTGIVGFAALIWLLYLFYRSSLRALRVQSEESFLIAGCIASVTCLILAFQTTSGFWFTYPWIVLAIGMAAVRLARERA